MKSLQFWSTVLGLTVALFILGGYAYNISAYASSLGEKVQTLQRQREEDKSDIKEDLKYIRGRVDEINKELQERK
jgi:peptidoglycan hydrolase CwlO-like protein